MAHAVTVAEKRRPFVMVLNHFAVPADAPGGTRHVELFSRLTEWDAEVVAASRGLITGDRTVSSDSIWRAVWVPPAHGAATRVLSWAAYGLTSLAHGLASRRRPDIVYASSPHLLAGLSGLVLARLRRAHYVLEIRDLWPQVLIDMGQLSEASAAVRVLRSLEHLLYSQAEAIVVMAAGVEEHLASRGFAGKLMLIPNGADPEDFRAGAGRTELRQRFGLEGFVVAYTGAHGVANGLDAVLDAARTVGARAPEVRFLLVGDGPLKEHLVNRARQEALSNVIFMDPIPKREVPALLGAVDAGLHVLADVPLFSYGVSPNKLFDYMAAGLPVITNTTGEMAELVTRAGAGLAVAPDAVAEGVLSLVNATAEQRRRWGDDGRQYMHENASRSAMAVRMSGLLASVMSSRALVPQ
jgi:glycosyltransferase involved in cell wall biosynthesis